MKASQLFVTGILAPFVILILMIVFVMIERAFGFYPGEPGWYVANIAVKKGDIKVCQKIVGVPWNIIGPTPGEDRMECIYDYAKLTHDPSICALLMPSDYGLSCAGGTMDFPTCTIESNYSVSWAEGNNAKHESLVACQNVDLNRSKTGNACCQIASVIFLKNINDCSPLKDDQKLFDECNYSLGFKNRDLAACALIHSDNIRAACLVSVKGLQKDPSICSDCMRPLGSIKDLSKK